MVRARGSHGVLVRFGVPIDVLVLKGVLIRSSVFKGVLLYLSIRYWKRDKH